MDTLPLLLLVALVAALALAAGYLAGRTAGARAALDGPTGLGLSAAATRDAVAPVRESLDRFDARLRQLESSRIEWHAQLREQVEAVRATSEQLRLETATLATALRRPDVRGRWGEMHLRRAVELAGLVERCDFSEQVALGPGGALRPDLVVHLAGGREVVVDAKVPLQAFLDGDLDGHARQLRTHVDQLGAKAYWRHLARTPEFVVLFVPGESFLAAALGTDPSLLEHAAGRRVVLATPTTLIALLRTVAHAWSEDRLADHAREVHRHARDLYERLGTAASHLDKMGRSLGAAVTAYNGAVASIESRVLVSARRLADLGVSDDLLPGPEPVDHTVRGLSAPELRAPELQDVGPPPTDDGSPARRAG